MFSKSAIIIFSGCVLCFLAYIYGIVFKVINTEENECEMTYMFEVPFFERIHFPDNVKFPKYGLYAYTEGALIQKIRDKVFDGLPVIFIPGNGGSYKQVRSFASVALRKSIDLKWRKELNYFSVDLNEEFSGIYGGYLNDQKKFIKLCILAVLNLYSKSHLNRNESNVILIGHSMGGKVAQSLLIDDDNDDNQSVLKHIHTIITLATPLDRPVINIDSNLNSFYETINNFLLQSKRINLSNRKNLTINHCLNCKLSVIETSSDSDCDDNLMIISIGGGNRDYMVRDGLALSKYSEINVLATHIPNVWTSTDHLCAVWCLQLARVLNRFLFELIQEYPKSRHQIGNNRNLNKRKLNFVQSKAEKLNIAEHYFLSPRNILGKEKIVPTLFPEYTDWFENSKRNFIEYFPNGLNKIRVQMIRLQDDVQHDVLTVKTMNIDVNNWIFGCPATQVTKINRFCGELIGLDYIMESIPSSSQYYQLHFQRIDLAEIRKQYPNWTHILLYIRPSSKKIKLYVNIHRRDDYSISVHTPYWFEYHKKIQHFKIPFGLYHYRVFLPDVFNVYQVLNVTIIPINCSTSIEPTLIKLCVPWMKGCNRYRFLRNRNDFSLLAYPSISKPVNYNNSENLIVIDLHFDSKCAYTMRYEVSLGGMLSQIIHQNFHRLPPYILAVLILIFQQQISHKSNKVLLSDEQKMGISSSFFVSTKCCFLMIGLLILSERFYLSSDDIQSNIFIDITLYGLAYTTVLICFTVLWLNIIFARKFLRIILHLITRRKHFLPILSVIIILIASISCGGLALCFACFIYFILLIKKYDFLYENGSFHKRMNVETQKSKEGKVSLSKSENGKDGNDLIDIRIHLIFLLILIVLIGINLPSMISWIKNFKYARILQSDSSFSTIVISLICISCIWQLPLPIVSNVSTLKYCVYWIYNIWCILCCITYCQQNVFYLNIVISSVLLLTSVTQIFS